LAYNNSNNDDDDDDDDDDDESDLNSFSCKLHMLNYYIMMVTLINIRCYGFTINNLDSKNSLSGFFAHLLIALG
jgi:hypothetical protein